MKLIVATLCLALLAVAVQAQSYGGSGDRMGEEGKSGGSKSMGMGMGSGSKSMGSGMGSSSKGMGGKVGAPTASPSEYDETWCLKLIDAGGEHCRRRINDCYQNGTMCPLGAPSPALQYWNQAFTLITAAYPQCTCDGYSAGKGMGGTSKGEEGKGKVGEMHSSVTASDKTSSTFIAISGAAALVAGIAATVVRRRRMRAEYVEIPEPNENQPLVSSKPAMVTPTTAMA